MDGRDPPPHFPLFPTNTPSNHFHQCTPELDSLVGRQQSLESLHAEVEAHQCKMEDLTAEAADLNAHLSLLQPESDDHRDSACTPWQPDMAASILHDNHTNSD